MHRKLWVLILVLAVAVFLVAGVRLITIQMEYRTGTQEYDQLAEDAGLEEVPPAVPEEVADILDDLVSASEEDGNGSQETLPALSLDMGHDRLREINSDYVGWLTLNENISYPIVQGSDNSYYLTHTFYGTQNKAGTLFIDASITAGLDAKNVIIYGHNLKNNTMFAKLMDYENQSYYEQHRYFSIYTEEGVSVYAIFAAFETGEISEAYQYGFANDDDFLRYIALMQSWSVIDTGISVGKDDQIVTLSTCTNVDNGRFIVQGKKIC